MIHFFLHKFSLSVWLSLALLLSLASCQKEDKAITGTAKVILTNAALNSAAQTLQVDGVSINNTALAYTQSTGTAGNPYLEMNAGIRAVKILATGAAAPVVEGNLVISPQAHYSIFTYDTLDALNHVKAMIVADQLTVPSAGKAKYRVFNLSPDSKFLDIQITRTGDTNRINGMAYVGNSTAGAGLSAFTEINAAPFGISIRQTDSTNLLINNQGISFEDGKIYSIYIRGRIDRGIQTAQGLNIGVLKHN